MADDREQESGPVQSHASTLLERVRVGETEAWQTFVRLYAPLVYHWCRRAGLQGSDAADVGREAFQHILDGLDGFPRGGPGSFRSWVRAVTHDKVKDFLWDRTNSHVGNTTDDRPVVIAPTRPGSPESDPVPETEPDPDEEHILYRRALDLVLADSREETRSAFVRVVFDRHDPATVAAELGLTLDTVCAAKSRVLHRLRGLFTDLFEPSPE